MSEDRNIYQIGTAPLLGEFELVILPSLIKVQVIKKKIVEQMPEPPLTMLAKHGDKMFRVVGRVGPYVVFHSDSQQFSKIHRNDFVDYVMGVLVKAWPRNERVDTNKISEEAIKKFNSLPQMFEG